MAGVKVGTITAPTIIQSKAYTGVGFEPGSIVLLTSRQNSTSPQSVHATLHMGAADLSNSFAASFSSESPAANSNTRRIMKTGVVISTPSPSADTIIDEATLASFDSDGFTLDHTIVSTDGSAGLDYHYIAFATGLSVKVGTFDLNASLGAQSVTGIGFQPKAMIFVWSRDDTTSGLEANGSFGLGAATSSTQEWAWSGVDTDSLASSDNSRYLANANCIVVASTSAVTAAADFTSMDSNGFTINVNTAPAAAFTVGYIALGGSTLTAFASTFTQRTSVGTKSETGVGFLPNSLLFGGTVVTANSVTANLIGCIGATSGTTSEGYIATSCNDAEPTMDNGRNYSSSHCVGVCDFNGAPVARAELSSFDADGFTVNWTDADSTARIFGYLALGIPEAPVAMSSNDTLCWFTPQMNEAPQSNYATLDLRNGHLVLDFDDSTQETAMFSAVMPRAYAGNGVTVYLHWGATTAIVGTGGWDVSFEQISDSAQDIDSDGFATAQTVTAATVPGTSGQFKITSVAITDGANMDSVTAGEGFRIRIRRDVSADTAVGDLELMYVEIKET